MVASDATGRRRRSLGRAPHPRRAGVEPIASQRARSEDPGEAEATQAALTRWLSRARQGDDEAFGELVRGYGPDVRRLCRRLLGPVPDAEDAAQESFLRAHTALASYDPQRPFRTWLLAIAAHRAIDALRRRRREARLFEAEAFEADATPGSGPSPLQHGLSSELRERLLDAIAAQPDRYRAPLVLRYYADLDLEAIAGILSVSRNQVATLLFRGRRRLRDALAEPGR